MPKRNNRTSLEDSLMNRRVVVSSLLAIFVMVSLANPAIAQAPSDAVLIMHFDEGSGTIAKDESGHGNDGTIYGATWTTGVSGKALSFDGVNDYVKMGELSSYPELTISSWVKFNSFSFDNQMMYHAMCGPDLRGGIGVNILKKGESLDFRAGSNCERYTPYNEIIYSTNNLNTDVWYHIAGVYSANKYMTLYINGSEIVHDTTGIPSSYVPNLQYIGTDPRHVGAR